MSKKKDSLKPWLSRPTINRSVTLPLTRPLTQRLSNLNEFHPNELDPFLLFDARDSMIGTLENPTLDLDPSKPDTLNVITATRAGNATFTDANGLIASASPNTVRVDQTQGAELTPTKFQRVGYTDFANANQWSKNDATLTSGQLSPTGDNTATKLTATGSDPWVYALINTSAQTHTFSFYCKGEGPTIGKTARVLFWYIGGATGTTQSVDFTYSGEWQRFEFQTTPTGAGTLAYRIDLPTDSFVVVGESVYIYGPQVEEGTTASDFVENTTGSPKFITGATFGPRVPMILVEPSSVNLLPYSEDFSNSAWGKFGGLVVTPAFADSPDGTTSGSKIIGIEGTDGDAGLSELVSASASTTYTLSAYFKASSDSDVGKKVRISMKRNGGTLVEALQQVTLSSKWVKHSVTMTTLSDNTGVWCNFTKENGSPLAERADECLLWGAQLETGSVSTSYIPTAGSTVTRAADNLVISGSDFDFYNASEGTVYTEFLYDHDQTPRYVYSITETGEKEIRSQIVASILRTRYTVNLSHLANLGNTGILKGSLNRAAFSYKTDNFRANLNGGSDTEDFSGTASINPIKLAIGSRGTANHLNGHIKRLIYWPYHSDSL